MVRWRTQSVVLMGLVYLLIAVPNVACSEIPEENTGIYQLGEVVVTEEREGVESIGTVREITKEDIQNSNARTLNEALELLPGLDIRTGAQGVPRVNLRGLRSRHVILLLNGIPLNSTFDGQFNSSIIPVKNIARIKVSYGNHSVLYGQGGLAGAVNIITKKGKDLVHGTVSGEVEERDSYLGSFTLSGGKKKVDFFLSGSASDTDGFPLSDDFTSTSEEGGGLRENSDSERNNFFANLGFTPNDILRIGLTFNYLKGEYGLSPSTINDKSDIFAKAPKYERVDDFRGYSLQLSTNLDLPGPVDMRGWFFINQFDEDKNRYDDENYNSMSDPSIKNTFHEDNEMSIIGGTLQTKCDLNAAGFLTLGMNTEHQEFESRGRVRDVAVGGGGGGGATYDFRTFDNDMDVDIYNGSMEYELSLLENLGIVLGCSYHWFEKEDNKSDDEGGFLAGAYYDILEKTRLRGSVARKIRFPSIRQLYDEESGNPDLANEKSYNYELGIEQELPWKTIICLTGFLMDVDDFIEKDVADVYQNHAEYRFQGVELTAETRFWENLMLRAGYTFLDTEDRSEGTERDELEYRPENKITLEAKYAFDFGFSTYINVMHVTDQYHYSQKAPLTKKRLNDYTLLNLKLDQKLSGDRFNLYLGVDNLFDEDYEESYGFPQVGQTFYGGMKIKF